MPHTVNPLGILTVSAGSARMNPEFARLPNAVMKEADEALYRAKLLETNCISDLSTADG